MGLYLQLCVVGLIVAGTWAAPCEITAGYTSTPVYVGPLCGREFNYGAEFVMVNSSTTDMPKFHARHMRTRPAIRLHQENSSAIEEDGLTTFLILQENAKFPGSSYTLIYMVTNIPELDLNEGECTVPYLTPTMYQENARRLYFLYRQNSTKIEVEPSEYSANAECPFQYRCDFNRGQFERDNELSLVSEMSHAVHLDPVFIGQMLMAESITDLAACKLLHPMKHQGHMIGTCPPVRSLTSGCSVQVLHVNAPFTQAQPGYLNWLIPSWR